jgi:hypothetical protein
LLDHTGPHLEAEEYIARTFGAEQSKVSRRRALLRLPFLLAGCCGVEFSAFALIVVLHDLFIFTSAEPTCYQKGQQCDVLACQFSYKSGLSSVSSR